MTQEIREWLCRISRLSSACLSSSVRWGGVVDWEGGGEIRETKMRASSSLSRKKKKKNNNKTLLSFTRVSSFCIYKCYAGVSLLSLNFLVWGGEGILPSPFSNGFNAANTNIIEKVPFFYK